ncbi:ubiquitin carboxyl-terminal hydrolase, partial [Phycomyces blakesleeanus]
MDPNSSGQRYSKRLKKEDPATETEIQEEILMSLSAPVVATAAPRKRGRKPANRENPEQIPVTVSTVATTAVSGPRKRGRKPANREEPEKIPATLPTVATTATTAVSGPRKRGRKPANRQDPEKIPVTVSTTTTAVTGPRKRGRKPANRENPGRTPVSLSTAAAAIADSDAQNTTSRMSTRSTSAAKTASEHPQQISQSKPANETDIFFAPWCTIESDPDIFTEMVQKYGVKNIIIQEIFDLDSKYFDAKSLLEGQNVHGLIFGFSYTEPELAKDDTAFDLDAKGIFYPSQVITNACATLALLGVLLNCRNYVDLGEELTVFKDLVKGFDPI